MRVLIQYTAQIQYIIVLNRQGRTRLAKWYMPFDDEEKRKLTTDVHRIVTSREVKFTNFVEVNNQLCFGCAISFTSWLKKKSLLVLHIFKIIYYRIALFVGINSVRCEFEKIFSSDPKLN